MQVVVLAGGVGSRLRPWTNTVPKPLLPVLDRTLLEHVVGSLPKDLVDEVVVAGGYKVDQIEAYFKQADAPFDVRIVPEAEPLGTGVFDVEKLLERLRFGQAFEDGDLSEIGEIRVIVDCLDAILDPHLFLGRGDVHVLDADMATIGFPHGFDDFPQGRLYTEAEAVVNIDLAVVIGFRKPVRFRVEFGMAQWFFQTQRIEIGIKMPAHAVRTDDHQRLDRIAGNVA